MEQRGNSAGWRKQIGVIFSRRVAQLVEHHKRLLEISAEGRWFDSTHGDKTHT